MLPGEARRASNQLEQTSATGTQFDVPANSGFTIEVKSGLCEYVCSFL